MSKRFRLLGYSLFGIVFILIFRYAAIMIVPATVEDQTSIQTVLNDDKESTSDRGPIVDRNGHPLAIQEEYFHVGLRPIDFRGRDLRTQVVAEILSPVLRRSVADIKATITYASDQFIYLAKWQDRTFKEQLDASVERLAAEKAAIADQARIVQLTAPTAAERERAKETVEANTINVQSVYRNFVSVDKGKRRFYPELESASQIIGFVKNNYRGGAGLESSLESIIAPGAERPVNRVTLTLDINVQHILERLSQRLLVEHKAESVMFIAVDPRSGEIIGAASAPGFDPNNYYTGEGSEYLWLYKPVTDVYEPGSVFKIFSLSALMEAGVVNNNSIFTCNGFYEHINNRGEREVIRCLSNHGRVGIREIIKYSCNAGAAYASDLLSKEEFDKILRDFGFGSTTGVGNPGESRGIFNVPSRWSERSKPTIAMGQEISVSAFQMVQAATAIANDGMLIPLKIVKEIQGLGPDQSRIPVPYDYDSNGKLKEAQQILSPAVARAMREYMVEVTAPGGTGRRIAVDDIRIAAKTGTAQIVDPASKTYSATDFTASCIAFFPAERPSLVVYLVISRPNGVSYYGSQIAAPPVGQAINELADYLGIPRGRNDYTVHSGKLAVPDLPAAPLPIEQMPDYTGYSKQQLLPLVENTNALVTIIGNGWVRRQNPLPGTLLNQESHVILELD
jgi:cell division protein FtsI (penicillin-binding protein 3)